MMPRSSTKSDVKTGAYEAFAWWLTREQIGLKLRERYQLSEEFPTRLRRLLDQMCDHIQSSVEGRSMTAPAENLEAIAGDLVTAPIKEAKRGDGNQ
jgi:hypothetical protein